ncbi:MAG: TonB family protein [Bacteroidales bacterium]|nr:TonB family protein [Bacteroidales bacterium]
MSKRKTVSANLENKKNIFLEIGFIVALIFILVALEWKTYDKLIYGKDFKSNYKEAEILPPILLKKKEVIPKKPQSFMALNIIDDDMMDDIIDIIDPFDDENTPLDDWIPPLINEDPIVEIIPYYKVEIKPEFPGGERAMLQFIANHFKVPREDLEMGLSGTIYVGFTIDDKGVVTNIKILRSISSASDIEAIRVVSIMPNWKPGRQVTKNVSVDFVLPIKVTLM